MRRLHIDRTRCDGHGACAELLPELLKLDEWGFPIVHGSDRDPSVPRGLEQLAQRAVKACPLMALRVA
ncbi:MAG: ferredoxin [Marmoricola sp.]